MNHEPTVLVIGYRAYGDTIFALPFLDYIVSLYPEAHFHFDLNIKAAQILHQHPALSCATLSLYEPDTWDRARRRWQDLEKTVRPIAVYNLQNTIERSCIATEDQDVFFASHEERSRRFGQTDFYGSHFAKFGIDVPDTIRNGNLGMMHFSPKEQAWAVQWRSKHYDDFVVIMPVFGSTFQKLLPVLEPLSRYIVRQYRRAFVYLACDPTEKGFLWFDERVIDTAGASFRQLALMTRYADLVIGPETGLMAAAGMWGTPKMYLATSSSLRQLCFYTKNDHSFQSSAPCSPCYRSCYTTRYCPKPNELLPSCVFGFDLDRLIDRVDYIHKQNIRHWDNGDMDRNAEPMIRKWSLDVMSPCPICGTHNRRFFDLWFRCDLCDIVYQTDFRWHEEIYDQGYVAPFLTSADMSRKTAQHIFAQMHRRKPGKFLDIGPATTAVADYAAEQGMFPVLLDCAPIQANGHRFIRGDFEHHAFDETFACIWASHVFEHFMDPILALRKAVMLLEPGGYLFVAMPDISLINPPYPHEWGHWKRLEHHIMFSRDSWERACRRAGLQVVYAVSHAIGTNHTNEFHVLARKPEE